MSAVTFIEKTDADGVTTEYAIIDRGNNEFTSMTKATYDEMIATQSTPNELQVYSTILRDCAVSLEVALPHPL